MPGAFGEFFCYDNVRNPIGHTGEEQSKEDPKGTQVLVANATQYDATAEIADKRKIQDRGFYSTLSYRHLWISRVGSFRRLDQSSSGVKRCSLRIYGSWACGELMRAGTRRFSFSLP
jgi:hypothetical protein